MVTPEVVVAIAFGLPALLIASAALYLQWRPLPTLSFRGMSYFRYILYCTDYVNLGAL